MHAGGALRHRLVRGHGSFGGRGFANYFNYYDPYDSYAYDTNSCWQSYRARVNGRLEWRNRWICSFY